MIQKFHSWAYIWKKNKNANLKIHTHPNVHSRFMSIHSRQDTEQLNHSLTDERIKKMWYVSY